jgi:hypothetical protein
MKHLGVHRIELIFFLIFHNVSDMFRPTLGHHMDKHPYTTLGIVAGYRFSSHMSIMEYSVNSYE